MEVDTQLLKAKILYHKKTQQSIAKEIGIARNTFAYKLRNNGFKVSDVQKMMTAIPLTEQDVIDIFFSN